MSAFTLTRRSALIGMASTLAAPAILRAASPYPSRQLSIVVPLATGGYNDRLARAFLTPLGTELGQNLIVVNRPGAGTVLGNTYFQQQPADGYTLMCTNLPFIMLTIMGGNVPYKSDDFTVINIPSRDFSLVASAPSRGINNIDEVFAKLKQDPSSVSIGLQPTSIDLVNTMLMVRGIGVDPAKLRLVTYDGAGPVRNAVLGGHVDIGVVAAEGYLTLKDRIRPLLIFDKVRSAEFPDAASIVEIGEKFGFKGDYVDGAQRSWLVRTAFKNEHPEDYAKLIAAFKKVTTDPAVVSSLGTQELESEWLGPEASQAIYDRTFTNLQKYADLLKPA